MESVLKKFKAMKEEGIRFVHGTQSKQSILLSNRYGNYNYSCNNVNENQENERGINIEDISKQIISIQNFINSKDSYRKHFEYYTSGFFQYFSDKFKELFNSYDFDSQINDIKMLLDSTEELIDEYSSISQSSGLLNQMKENCCLLDSLLQGNYAIEKEELNKVKAYSNKIKIDFNYEDGVSKLWKNANSKRLKSLMRYAKVLVIKEKNTISKSVNYNDGDYIGESNCKSSAIENNYDIKIYFNKKEQRSIIKKCLNYIKKNMIMQYVIAYDKKPIDPQHDNDDDYNDVITKYDQSICYRIFGVGKSYSLFSHHLYHLMKTRVTLNVSVKCSIYSSIDYILNKNLSSLPSHSIIHHNFNIDYINQYYQ